MKERQIERKIQLPAEGPPGLEIVLKCDSAGSVEAVGAALTRIAVPGGNVSIVRSGIGAVSKSDIFLAGTAGRLVVGFQVGVTPGLDKLLRDNGVQVRLYELIYRLSEDLRTIAESIASSPAEEEVIGSGAVIALFKGARKGIIIGCEVKEGHFAVGQRFRLISAMGPSYSGAIESMHIEEKAVQKAVRGQKVGISIRNFGKARVGDIVESFKAVRNKGRWQPKAGVIRVP